MPEIEKVVIVGLDSADPGLVFERWLDDLPTLRRLVQHGLWGRLESCIPPLTVPAWSCMASGKDPGELGVYAFRNRRDWSYENLAIATNIDIRQPRLWDHVGRAGHPSILLGVPQTFPIVRPPRGCQVTCFLTPGRNSPYTHPPELKDEIAEAVGEYVFDVSDIRRADRAGLLEDIRRMAAQRFTLARHLLNTHPWTLLWLVEMGLDRVHHGFWHDMDPQHRRYTPGSPFENAIRDYYRFLDEQLAQLLDNLDLNRTAVWVVSDHGAQRMDGGFCLNDWLLREGFLTLKTPLSGVRRFELADVDWARTTAWADGGYTGQVFLNCVGREPQGVVEPDDVDAVCAALRAKLQALHDPAGRPMSTRVFRPEDTYDELLGFPPDLIVHLDDLRWRCVGSVGHADLFVYDDEAGPDDANHAQAGLYVLSHPSLNAGRHDATLYDVVPTTLKLLGLPRPPRLSGRALVE